MYSVFLTFMIVVSLFLYLIMLVYKFTRNITFNLRYYISFIFGHSYSAFILHVIMKFDEDLSSMVGIFGGLLMILITSILFSLKGK